MFRPKRRDNIYCCPEHQLLHNNKSRSRGTGLRKERKQVSSKPKQVSPKPKTGKLVDTTPLPPELIRRLENKHDVVAVPMVLVETSPEVAEIIEKMARNKEQSMPVREWTRDTVTAPRSRGNG